MGLPLGTDTLRAGGGVIAFARHPGFSSQPRSKTPAPIRVDFYIGSTSPYAHGALFCLGAGSGIPPAAAPSFRGVKKEKLHEVSRIEPSGQGISPIHAPHMALALAEQVGFEPTHDFHRLSVFKTVPLSTWVLFRTERTGEW